MRKISLALALIASIFALPAHADFTAKDASAATITFKNPGICTSVVCVPVFQLYDGTNVVTLTTAGADGVSNTLTGLPAYSRMLSFNGTTWDRWQGAVKIASGGAAAGALAAGAGVDGWDLTQGAIADAAVTAGATGSVSAKLRAISRDIGTIATNSALPLPPQSVRTVNIGEVDVDFSRMASAAISVSTITTTQLVALSGSTKVYVTSYDVIAGGTGNITFVYGTGSSCGTGTTSLTGAYNLTAQAGIAKGSGIAPVLVVPAGNALCVTTSAAVQMSGSVSYQQF